MNIFRKNNILIDGLLGDTFAFLQSTYNQTANVFTVASAWGQILFVLQNISQLILYFIEVYRIKVRLLFPVQEGFL